MNSFPHLAQRLFNVPIAIHPRKAEVVMAALADRFGIAQLFRGGQLVAKPGAFSDEDEGDDFSSEQPDRPYAVVGGVAVIPIRGTLVHKLGTLRPYSGMTGYDGIRLNLLAALNDAEVKAIVFDIDSPGGEVSGCFDLVDFIRASRQRSGGKKPIWAILDDAAYSAAYAIASATDRITVPRTGGVGSIGVIVMQTEWSRALDEAGITVNIIRYGEHKAEGSPYEALSDGARARIQAPIDSMGDLFVETVALNRGITAKVIRDTKAEVFTGPAALDEAIKQGFADEIAAPDAAFLSLLRSL